MEQRNHRPRIGVDARQIGSFVPIASIAGERETGRIAFCIQREPPCCFGTTCSTWNAIRGVANWGRRQYSHAFPALARTRPRVRWSNQAACRERTRRAFACIMETISTASTKSWYSASSAGVSVPSFALPRSSSIRASGSGSARRLRSRFRRRASVLACGRAPLAASPQTNSHHSAHLTKRSALQRRTLRAGWPPPRFVPDPTRIFSGGFSICQGTE
jgi:hypothetical protein